MTLSGSLVAWAKLSEKLSKNRLYGLGAQWLNVTLLVVALLCMWWGGFLAEGPWGAYSAHFLLFAAALALGVGLVVPIGGADMPVVISLLNSYSGLAACATGFVLHNNLLVIAGSLVGASGLILTRIMCKAMNRSLKNVLFAKFGDDGGGERRDTGYTNVKATTAEEAAMLLETARDVIVVPGYGMAVAQGAAQGARARERAGAAGRARAVCDPSGRGGGCRGT